jgi:hypothetical protein
MKNYNSGFDQIILALSKIQQMGKMVKMVKQQISLRSVMIISIAFLIFSMIANVFMNGAQASQKTMHNIERFMDCGANMCGLTP